MAHEAGKGDKRRPGDDESFSNGYELAFGNKKPTRGSFIWDEAQGKMIPKDEYIRPDEANAPTVLGDIQPYRSMVTGEVIQSRSAHRQHLKQHGLVEVGNETKHLKNQPKQMDSKALKESIARQVYNKLRY